MAKHIGIIAISSEGAALCYRTICQEAPAIMGKFAHPEISMHTHSLSRYMDYIEKDDWDNVASLMYHPPKNWLLQAQTSRYAQTTRSTDPLKK